MSKAYDRIEWSDVIEVMSTFVFSQIWLNLICGCISTVSFSLMMNGRRCDAFVPKKGIRQGDPLSSYLFILCAEGLVSLVKDAKSRGLFRVSKWLWALIWFLTSFLLMIVCCFFVLRKKIVKLLLIFSNATRGAQVSWWIWTSLVFSLVRIPILVQKILLSLLLGLINLSLMILIWVFRSCSREVRAMLWIILLIIFEQLSR